MTCANCVVGQGFDCMWGQGWQAGRSTFTWYQSFCVSFILLLLASTCTPAPVTYTPTDVQTFRDPNDLQNTLRYFQNIVYEPSLQRILIGAKNYLYSFDPTDLSRYQRSVLLTASNNDVMNCRGITPISYFCDNYITQYALKDGEIFACGTGAYAPKIYFLRTRDLSLIRHESAVNNPGICPFYPSANATLISSADGNPLRTSDVYVVTPFFLRNLMQQEFFRLTRYSDRIQTLTGIDAKFYFNGNPEAVGIFDISDHIIFFFRETALETNLSPSLTFSRVGRICKNDKGGEKDFKLENRFTSFFKARLVCSTGGTQPFHYNLLQDIKRISSAAGDRFYGIFSSDVTGYPGSAVCVYTYSSMNQVFAGNFLHQAGDNQYWTEEAVPKGDKYKFKSAAECVNDSFSLTVFDHQFIETHTLMDDSVQPLGDLQLPVYTHPSITYRRMAIQDMVVQTIDGSQEACVLYLVTDYGHIYKVLVWNEGSADEQSRELQIMKPFGDDVVVVQDIHLLDENLFISSNQSVKRLDARGCKAYTMCTSCVLDPHCGWDSVRDRCEDYTSVSQATLIQSTFQHDSLLTCSLACKSSSNPDVSEISQLGSSVVLSCASNCEADEITWTKDGQDVIYDVSSYLLTNDFNLVILNASGINVGNYVCKTTSNDVSLAVHRVEISDCATPECIWQEEFRRWCSEFETYKENFNNWVCMKNKCLESDQCIPQDFSGQCVP